VGSALLIARRSGLPWIGTACLRSSRFGYSRQKALDVLWPVADYVDRLLKGANSGELPVQEPVKFELVINDRTAKALNLDIPPMPLATADEGCATGQRESSSPPVDPKVLCRQLAQASASSPDKISDDYEKQCLITHGVRPQQ
jgi:hypothetical protein